MAFGGRSTVMRTLTAFGPSLRWDERLAVSLLLLAIAGWLHAVNYTAAESAHPSKRWLFRRTADAFGILALYVLARLWI